ncbi:MAG: extracellular solute-binding protein [Candidatus Thorarchaeota archaeon]
MQRKIWAFMLGCFLMLVPLLVFQPSNGTPSQAITIRFWYTENDAEKPGVLKLVSDFEAANPSITVEAEQKGFFDARSLYQNAYIAAEEPPVFRAARDWVIEFAQANMILPLDDYFTTEDEQDFIPNALRLVTYPGADGKLHYFGFPQVVDAPALFYNKHLFEQAGIDTSQITVETSWTWDEFKQNCLKLANPPSQYAFTMAGMFFGAQGIFFGHGGKIFTGDTVSISDIAIDSPESLAAFEAVKEIADANYTPAWDLQGWGTLNTYFASPSTLQVAMIQQGPWELRNFLDNSIEFNGSVSGAKSYASADNLGIMQLPHDEEGHQGAPLGGHAYVVSKGTPPSKVEAAVKLAKFMASKEAMKLRAMKYYLVPPRQSVFEDSEVQASDTWDYLQVFKKMTDVATQVPVSHYWAQLETDLANEMDEYLADESTLSQFINATIALWKTYLPSGAAIETESEDEYTPGFGFVALIAAVPIMAIAARKKKRMVPK